MHTLCSAERQTSRGSTPSTLLATGKIDVSNLNGSNGFVVTGLNSGDQLGLSVAGLGDINGDQVADFVVGSPFREGNVTEPSNEGRAYVVFGQPSGQSFTATLAASALEAGTGGFSISGEQSYGRLGSSVGGGADVNGDGINDIIVGAPYVNPGEGNNAGRAYILFGKASGQSFGANIEASSLNGVNGYIVSGRQGDDNLGRAVTIADVNGDGISDIIIGADEVDATGGRDSGTTYVIFGGAANLAALDAADGTTNGIIQAVNIAGTRGLRFDGEDRLDNIGNAVAGDHDVNGDGNADLLIGAFRAEPSNAGKAYLLFGGNQFGVDGRAIIRADSVDGQSGFRLNGVSENDYAGQAVVLLGDVNGDGFGDALIGAPGYGGSNNGTAYFVAGAASGFSNTSLAGNVRFDGETASDDAGEAVGRAGDINGDGIADFLIGVPDHISSTGAAYVIFGNSSGFTNTTLDSTLGSVGFELRGGGSGSYGVGQSLDASGDINGDGLADILLGAPGGSSDYATLIFGATSFSQTNDITTLDNGTSGFRMEGPNGTGRSVEITCDLNGDGLNDLIVGAPFTTNGQAFVVFGATSFTSSPTITLTNLDGTNGFTFNGALVGDRAGQAVAGIGDFNGDGFGDFVIGAHLADPNGFNSGATYIVFGATNIGSSGALAPSDLSGANGFVINGLEQYDRLGYSASGAGDVNGDGFDDVIIGSYYGEGIEDAVVLFGGSAVGSSGSFDIAGLNGASGFFIGGVDSYDQFSRSVGGAGDINGDGFDDLLVSAPRTDPEDLPDDAGQSFFIFGADFANVVTNVGLTGADGFTGTGGDDVFVGGAGNDVLIGGGGIDVLKGGAGDDLLSVGDLNFRRVEGDSGTDTLQFSMSGSTIDLRLIANNKTTGFEKFDITGTGNNTLAVSLQDVLDLSDTSNTLFVAGNTGDTVTGSFTGGTVTQNVVIDSVSYTQYVSGQGTLLVETDITQSITV